MGSYAIAVSASATLIQSGHPGIRLPSRRRRTKRASRSSIAPEWIQRFYGEARGRYRIFNSAEYRFYRSNSGPPAESDTPFATNATLPHTPSDTYADGTWYLSVSYFNGVIDSGFLPVGPNGETYLRLDISGGVTTNAPPNGPIVWNVEPAAATRIKITGVYFQTGSLRADEWAIAFDHTGTPPADAPDDTRTMPTSGLALLEYEFPLLVAWNHGDTVNVRLQTRRNDGTDAVPSWVYSEDSEVKSIVADGSGPTAITGPEIWTGRLPEDL